ncbi:amino acid/polyamine transporter I [Aspergillus undulatus]|uniref:amino acid/polyamine transporter I n=1 Tax=Aspergillus undulatus TaxID=1810928 RepID=UPI003CCD323A
MDSEKGITTAQVLDLTASSSQPSEPKKNFSLLSTLGLNFSICAAPLAIGSYLSLSIAAGGPPFFIYAFIFAGIGQIILCIALAEVASALPHSSGPAFWITFLGPTRGARLLGYIIGWLTNACWWCITAASSLFPAQMIIALADATTPSYEPKVWHTYLVYLAFVTNAFLVNLPRVIKVISWSLSASVVIINGSALFILISLLIRTNPKQSAEIVFKEVVNKTGWDSNVVVFFLTLLPGAACVGGLDSATHLADEVEQPSKRIPQVMIGSALLNFAGGFISIIILLFCNTDPQSLLKPVGGQPLFQLFFNAYNSRPLSIAACVCCIFSFNLANWAAMTSWNRLYWSFSRQGGFPFSKFSAKLSSSGHLPLNALYINTVLAAAVGALQLGSSTAMNALLGGASLCGKMSFAMCLVALLWRGCDALPKDRWLNLGKWGLFIDYVALLWVLWVSVWVCFPVYVPVTASSMNYAAGIFVAVSLVSLGYYFAAGSRAEMGLILHVTD